MVSNIDKMIESVLEMEDLRKELAEKETYDDVYDFCYGIQDGYTRDELFEFLSSNQDEYAMDAAKLDKEILSHIRGGTSVGVQALSAMKFYKDMKNSNAIFKPQNNDDIFKFT